MSQHGYPGTAGARPVVQVPESTLPDPAPGYAAQPMVEPLRLIPLVPRRQAPRMLVEVDGTPAGHRALVWALREAARREAVVVAVAVLDDLDGDPLDGTDRPSPGTRETARDQLDAAVLRAVAETGITGRARTAVLERPVFDALDAAVHGADLVMVGTHGKRLLRPAVPRQPLRRVVRGA